VDASLVYEANIVAVRPKCAILIAVGSLVNQGLKTVLWVPPMSMRAAAFRAHDLEVSLSALGSAIRIWKP
jgi:hypothetical protein